MERRTRRRMTAGVLGAVLAIVALVPSFATAQGNLVDGLLKGLLGNGGSAGSQQSGGGAIVPAGGVPGPNSDYNPPLHGGNPHGQGTVGVVDLAPSNTEPLPSDPADGDEDVVIGDTQGEQNGDQYHGRTTAVYADVLGLINTEQLIPAGILTIETNEEESKDGVTAPLNNALAQVCAQTGNLICLSVLDMNSTTTANGSQNSFSAANVGVAVPGAPGISAAVGESNGSISDDGVCQTASGDSSVVNANVVGLTATALEASSTSTACNNGTPSSTTNDSDVFNLAGFAIPLPAAGCPGPNETPDTEFDILGIAAFVCNADDRNGAQTSSPYGVREALAAFVLPVLGGVAKVSLGGPESHAVAPAAATTPTPGANPPANPAPSEGGGRGEKGGPGDDGGDPVAATAQPGDELPFTGTNLVVLGLIGAALLFGGVALAGSARHRRAAA